MHTKTYKKRMWNNLLPIEEVFALLTTSCFRSPPTSIFDLINNMAALGGWTVCFGALKSWVCFKACLATLGHPQRQSLPIFRAGHLLPIDMSNPQSWFPSSKFPAGNAGEWLELQVTRWLSTSWVKVIQSTFKEGNTNLNQPKYLTF